RGVAGLLRCLTLHRGDQDFPALLSGFLPDARLGSANALCDLAGQLAFDGAEQLCARFLLGQRGHTLQLPLDRRALVFDRLAQRFELGLAAPQALLIGIQLAQAALDALLTLAGALLEPGYFGAALADLGLAFVTAARRLLLCRQEDGLAVLLGDHPHVFLTQVVGVAHFAGPRDAAPCVQQRADR